jgi:Ca2+-binding EF-hand superfamily protein
LPAVSFELFDLDGTKHVSKEEMTTVLRHMNNTVSFFGDDMMADDDIVALVNDIFEKFDVSRDGQLDYAEYMRAVAEHPKIVEFIATSPSEDAKAPKDESK